MQSAAKLREKLRAERTNLVPKMIETWDEIPLVLQLMAGSDPLYGYVGMDDDTLYPFVRPGAFVRIDPRQKKIPSTGWHGDHDRPIFFVELREHYVCTWCEMLDGRLILVPSQQSKSRSATGALSSRGHDRGARNGDYPGHSRTIGTRSAGLIRIRGQALR